MPKEKLADVSGDDWTRLLVSKVLRNADGEMSYNFVDVFSSIKYVTMLLTYP